jgi:hypothetical protein
MGAEEQNRTHRTFGMLTELLLPLPTPPWRCGKITELLLHPWKLRKLTEFLLSLDPSIATSLGDMESKLK